MTEMGRYWLPQKDSPGVGLRLKPPRLWRRRKLRTTSIVGIIAALMMPMAQAAGAPSPPIPAPTQNPMAIDPSTDPILGISRSSESIATFRALVQDAVKHHPQLNEVVAARDEATAARSESVAQLYPTVDLSISNFQTLSRAFSNDPQNIIERSRARQRTDATLAVQQPVFDFGAASFRVAAASARLRAASADIDSTTDQLALRVIATWYEVFAYRSLLSLSTTFADNQRDLRRAVQMRIAQGVSAAGDIALVDSYVGTADRRVAETTRALAGAEARYTELIGTPPPAGILRAPTLPSELMSKDMAGYAAGKTTTVIAAEAIADASRKDAKAARFANYPNITVGVDVGRYGVFETARDYDIRARVTLRQRLFGGVDSRARQVAARARAADARAQRVREEAVRDASIAWSDVAALQAELAALENSYIASRVSRDVIVERFRVSRGTLFDVLSAEDNLLGAASAYIRSLTELDTARYALLSKTGRLIEALEIKPQQGGPQR
jgi:outer membrane protein, adhesin transport system